MHRSLVFAALIAAAILPLTGCVYYPAPYYYASNYDRAWSASAGAVMLLAMIVPPLSAPALTIASEGADSTVAPLVPSPLAFSGWSFPAMEVDG